MTEPTEWSRPGDEPGDAPPPSSPGSGSGSNSAGLLLPVVGLMVAVLAGLAVALVAFTQRDTGERFPANRGDADYVLQDMTLREADVPPGMARAAAETFDNGEWALARAEDPEDTEEVDRLTKQAESTGRIGNFISVFTWTEASSARFGLGLRVTSQSTLYDSEESAKQSIAGKELCGLLVTVGEPIEDFTVPTLGDGSTGFAITTVDDSFGRSVETVVCFRTGRIVHGVVQTSFDGAQDIGLVVRLAERMLERIDETFEGTPAEQDPAPIRPTGG